MWPLNDCFCLVLHCDLGSFGYSILGSLAMFPVSRLSVPVEPGSIASGNIQHTQNYFPFFLFNLLSC